MEPHCRNTALTPNTPLAVCQCLKRLVGGKSKQFVRFRVTLFSSSTPTNMADRNHVQNLFHEDLKVSVYFKSMSKL